jgi:hypothetical protein
MLSIVMLSDVVRIVLLCVSMPKNVMLSALAPSDRSGIRQKYLLPSYCNHKAGSGRLPGRLVVAGRQAGWAVAGCQEGR